MTEHFSLNDETGRAALEQPTATTESGKPDDLRRLLDDAQSFLRGYVVLTDAQTTAVVLWAAHTHAIDAFEVTPFLAINSPEKRCGKSRLLDVLELLVARPWRTIMPSEAVLFRKIAHAEPTVLLDETDAIFNAKNSNTEPLRAVLNAGNRRGTSVPRCVGPTQQLVDFDTFSAKALAGIGTLPDTIMDRSIPIRMARKRKDETAMRFRRREADPVAEQFQRRLAAWAEGAVGQLETARPNVPDALDDRAEEAWEPLLAIADLAGGNWPERARAAALQLSADGERDEEALGVKLLADIHAVFEKGKIDRLSSAQLADRLGELEESPWGDLWGKPLDARGLAGRLKPFEIRPRVLNLGDGTTARGYRIEDLEDVFSRYLSGSERNSVTLAQPCEFAAQIDRKPVTDEVPLKRARLSQSYGVTVETGQEAAGGVLSLGEPGYPMVIDAAFAAGHIIEDELAQLTRVHRFVNRSHSVREKV